MNSKEHSDISQKIIEINASRFVSKNGKTRFRDLTPNEEAELAALNEKLVNPWSDDEWNLFSWSVRNNGGTIIEKIPEQPNERIA